MTDRTGFSDGSDGRDAGFARHLRCGNCGEAGNLRNVAPRVTVCAVCRFIAPRALPILDDSPAPRSISDALATSVLFSERYRLVRPLGAGAHGSTYLAEHRLLNHPCVVKLVPIPRTEPGDRAAARLRNEARAGLRVNSPFVVRVLDCDTVEGAWFFVMEYVAGVDLSRIAAAKVRMDWRQAVHVTIDGASGLAAIHRAGLVHRDIKPGNLILGEDGRLRIADLGIARVADDRLDARAAERGGRDDGAEAEIGTIAYAAPEMLIPGAVVDRRSDLYSLGSTIFELVTGSPPRSTASVYRALLEAHDGAVSWPPDAPEDVPAWFRAGLQKLLSPAAHERFESAEELLEYIEHPHGAAQRDPGAAKLEASPPRGLTVLTFENESGQRNDDWLSHALADHLARSLARAPGVYVSDRDEYLRVLERLAPGASRHDPQVLKEAGRLTGAATVIRGRFVRREGEITIWAQIQNAAANLMRAVEPVEGPLAKFAELRARLLRRVCRELEVEVQDDAAVGGDNPPPAAQEAFFAAKRAHLRGEYESAIEHAASAVSHDPEFCEAIGMLGACCSRLGRYDEAARHHLKQEQIAARRGDGRQVVEAQANLGVMHYFRGEYEAAYDFYQRAAHTAEALGLANELAQICNNLGFVLFRLGRREDARNAFQRAIETHRAFGALVFLIGPYNGMGNLLRDEQRYEEAREYYQRALSLALESDDRVNAGISYMHLGRCALDLGRIAVAKHELAMALSAMEETRFWNGLTRVYGSIAEMNLRLGSFTEAARCADKQIELARLHANRGMEAGAWRLKAQALRAAGATQEAETCQARAAELDAAQQSTPTTAG